jgi:saccharopine dehydrogenase-like NADP-dependent oxidoreductase
MEKEAIVWIGAGAMGQAIARRVGTGKPVLLADLEPVKVALAATTWSEAGFKVSTAMVDIAARPPVHALVEKATRFGVVVGLIHAAGVSPPPGFPCHDLPG